MLGDWGTNVMQKDDYLYLDGGRSDEYMHQREDESDAAYAIRLSILRERRRKRMSEREKQLVTRMLKDRDKLAPIEYIN
jgi:hypothetical protein